MIRGYPYAFLFIICLCLIPSLAKAEKNKYAAISIHFNTHKVLHAQKATALRHPASLTKMMTLYCLFEHLKAKTITLDTPLNISEYAASKPASKLYLKPGEAITVQQAIYALTIKSANDAAVVIAEALAKNEKAFAIHMTQKAKELGMKKTAFQNASGLHHPKQYTTALDISLLASALIKGFPEYYPFFSAHQFSYKNRIYYTHNALLGQLPGVDGLKTGYVHSSGYNLAISALRDKERIIAIVLGAKTSDLRNAHMAKLVEKSFLKIQHQTKKQTPSLFSYFKPEHSPKTPKQSSEKKLGFPLFSYLGSTQKQSSKIPKNSPEKKLKIILKHTQKKSELNPQPSSFDTVENWSVQLGSFYSSNEAKELLDQFRKKYPDMYYSGIADIQIFKTENNTYYRSRLTHLQKKAAQSLCKELKKINTECLILKEYSS